MFSTRESFDFILAELEKREAGSDKLLIDGHFMPYSRYYCSLWIALNCVIMIILQDQMKYYPVPQHNDLEVLPKCAMVYNIIVIV